MLSTARPVVPFVLCPAGEDDSARRRPVNAVRGFIDTIASLVTREQPSRLVVCPGSRLAAEVPDRSGSRHTRRIGWLNRPGTESGGDIEDVPDTLTRRSR